MDGEFYRDDPFRMPNWRSRRVLQLLQHRPEPLRLRRWDDHAVRVYYRFLCVGTEAVLDGRKPHQAFSELPDVAAAHRLHYSPDLERRQILEARLLTNETFAAIASRLGIEPKAVEYYENLFFSVRDRMAATDWIIKVILASPATGQPGPSGTITAEQRGMLYRLFAYHGGPLVLDAIISGIGGLTMPQKVDDVADCLDQASQQILSTRAALAAHALPFDSKRALKLIKLALKKRSSKPSRAARAEEEAQMERYMAMVAHTMSLIHQDFIADSANALATPVDPG